MSLYEVSDITPGQSLLARDLIGGGESILIHKATATQTLMSSEADCRASACCQFAHRKCATIHETVQSSQLAQALCRYYGSRFKNMIQISRRRFLQSAGAGAVLMPFGRPSQAEGASLGFLVVGDWGKPERLEAARKVAAQMGKTAEALQTRFVISAGDNFYPQGVISINDPKWRTSYEEVYKDLSLMCPWYVVLGNHDRDGNEQAQIDYASTSTRWRMPSHYYSTSETLADGGTADFFFLNTDPINDLNWTDRWLWSNAEVQRQIDWLEEELAKSRSAWKIVVGHHPVFSGGQHGSSPELIDVLKPLFDRYGVRAYINGHDHDLQHIVQDDVHYLTCGSGCEVRETRKIDGSLFASATLGFMSAQITSKEMSFGFVSESGEIVYASTIPATSDVP